MYEINTEEIIVNWGKREIILREGDWTIKVVPTEAILNNTRVSLGKIKQITKSNKEKEEKL